MLDAEPFELGTNALCQGCNAACKCVAAGLRQSSELGCERGNRTTGRDAVAVCRRQIEIDICAQRLCRTLTEGVLIPSVERFLEHLPDRCGDERILRSEMRIEPAVREA